MKQSKKLLLSKLDEKFSQQTLIITSEVTKNVKQALDEKLK